MCPRSLSHRYISSAQVVEHGDCAARWVYRIWAAVRVMNVISGGDIGVGSVKGNGTWSHDCSLRNGPTSS